MKACYYTCVACWACWLPRPPSWDVPHERKSFHGPCLSKRRMRSYLQKKWNWIHLWGLMVFAWLLWFAHSMCHGPLLRTKSLLPWRLKLWAMWPLSLAKPMQNGPRRSFPWWLAASSKWEMSWWHRPMAMCTFVLWMALWSVCDLPLFLKSTSTFLMRAILRLRLLSLTWTRGWWGPFLARLQNRPRISSGSIRLSWPLASRGQILWWRPPKPGSVPLWTKAPLSWRPLMRAVAWTLWGLVQLDSPKNWMPVPKAWPSLTAWTCPLLRCCPRDN